MTTKQKGGCMCGAVRYVAALETKHSGACHCDMCRKWSSGPYMSVQCKGDVVFTGEENISVYKSSEWAERGFCKKCGSNLYDRLSQTGTCFIAMGSFDDQDFEFKQQARVPFYG